MKSKDIGRLVKATANGEPIAVKINGTPAESGTLVREGDIISGENTTEKPAHVAVSIESSGPVPMRVTRLENVVRYRDLPDAAAHPNPPTSPEELSQLQMSPRERATAVRKALSAASRAPGPLSGVRVECRRTHLGTEPGTTPVHALAVLVLSLGAPPENELDRLGEIETEILLVAKRCGIAIQSVAFLPADVCEICRSKPCSCACPDDE